MRTYIAILILSALGSFLATPWARRLPKKIGAVDQPSDRKIHSQPTPRLGGIAVFIGFCLPFGIFYILQNRVSAIFRNYEKPVLALVLAGIAMLILGIYDDCRGADARKKFAVQIPAALFLYYFGFRVDVLSNPFGQPIHLGWLG